MADQSDVEQVLASTVAAALLPSGTSGPSSVGLAVRIYRGWPDPKGLAADLAEGIINVTLSSDPGSQVVTTRYPPDELVANVVAPTLFGSVHGNTAVFAGDARPGQIAGLLVDGLAGVHRTVAGDTPVTVAEKLATALASRNAMGSGTSVLVLGARSMIARVVADQPSVRELRRQRQVFRITCWCPDPTSRDATAILVDAALAAVSFLTLPDGLAGRLRFVSSVPVDRAQAAGLYRRDLSYSVDYATSSALPLATLLFGNTRAASVASLITNHLS